MHFPCRCWRCNKPIAHKWPQYEAYVTAHNGCWKGVWKEIGITRPCCMAMFAAHVPIDRLLCSYNPADCEIVYQQRLASEANAEAALRDEHQLPVAKEATAPDQDVQRQHDYQQQHMDIVPDSPK